MTEEDKAVLTAIKEQHNITQKEIVAKLGWKVDRVKYYLNKMKHRNIVKRVETSQKGYWEVVIEDNKFLTEIRIYRRLRIRLYPLGFDPHLPHIIRNCF